MTTIYEVHTRNKTGIYVNHDLWVIVAPNGRGNIGSHSWMRAETQLSKSVPVITVVVDDEWWAAQKDWLPTSFDDIVLHYSMYDASHPNCAGLYQTAATRNWLGSKTSGE